MTLREQVIEGLDEIMMMLRTVDGPGVIYIHEKANKLKKLIMDTPQSTPPGITSVVSTEPKGEEDVHTDKHNQFRYSEYGTGSKITG